MKAYFEISRLGMCVILGVMMLYLIKPIEKIFFLFLYCLLHHPTILKVHVRVFDKF